MSREPNRARFRTQPLSQNCKVVDMRMQESAYHVDAVSGALLRAK